MVGGHGGGWVDENYQDIREKGAKLLKISGGRTTMSLSCMYVIFCNTPWSHCASSRWWSRVDVAEVDRPVQRVDPAQATRPFRLLMPLIFLRSGEKDGWGVIGDPNLP